MRFVFLILFLLTFPDRIFSAGAVTQTTDVQTQAGTTEIPFLVGKYQFRGSIADKYPIQMTLVLTEEADVSGFYSYDKHPGQTLFLQGKLDPKGWLYLSEYETEADLRAGKTNAAFSGNLGKDAKIDGYWASANRKTRFPFSLKGSNTDTSPASEPKVRMIVITATAQVQDSDEGLTEDFDQVWKVFEEANERYEAAHPWTQPEHEFDYIDDSKAREPKRQPAISRTDLPRALRAADSGDIDACHRLVNYYLCNQGAEHLCEDFDPGSAEKYARRAIELGGNVGLCDSWAYGVEFPQDLTFAVRCYATQGDLESALWLLTTKFKDSAMLGVERAKRFVAQSKRAQYEEISIPDEIVCPENLDVIWIACTSGQAMSAEEAYQQDLDRRRGMAIEKRFLMRDPQARASLEDYHKSFESFSQAWAHYCSVIVVPENLRLMQFSGVSLQLGQSSLGKVPVDRSLVEIDKIDRRVSLKKDIEGKYREIRAFFKKKLKETDEIEEEDKPLREKEIATTEEAVKKTWEPFQSSKLRLLKEIYKDEKLKPEAWDRVDSHLRGEYLELQKELLKDNKEDSAYN